MEKQELIKFELIFLALGIILVGFSTVEITSAVIGAEKTVVTLSAVLGIISLFLAFICHYTILTQENTRGGSEKVFATKFSSRKTAKKKKK